MRDFEIRYINTMVFRLRMIPYTVLEKFAKILKLSGERLKLSQFCE